ncbi:hypothetical protein AKJ16_DCAP06488 [Drosera capensis]
MLIERRNAFNSAAGTGDDNEDEDDQFLLVVATELGGEVFTIHLHLLPAMLPVARCIQYFWVLLSLNELMVLDLYILNGWSSVAAVFSGGEKLVAAGAQLQRVSFVSRRSSNCCHVKGRALEKSVRHVPNRWLIQGMYGLSSECMHQQSTEEEPVVKAHGHPRMSNRKH